MLWWKYLVYFLTFVTFAADYQIIAWNIGYLSTIQIKTALP